MDTDLNISISQPSWSASFIFYFFFWVITMNETNVIDDYIYTEQKKKLPICTYSICCVKEFIVY